MNNTQRPFKVLGIQQVAIGGTDKQRMKTLWVDMLGLEQTGTFQSERENVDEDILAMGRAPSRSRWTSCSRWTSTKSPPCTPRRSTTSACGSTTCPRPWNGSPPGRALCARWHPQGRGGF
jgi:hypothetical protein